jgi:hypothetical protein
MSTLPGVKENELKLPACLCGCLAGVPVTVKVGLSAGCSDRAFGPFGVFP